MVVGNRVHGDVQEHGRGHRHSRCHPHGHGHTHGRGAAGRGGREANVRALAGALAVTVCFLVVETLGGFLCNSLALISDAGHMLSDAASLGLSLFAVWFAGRPAPADRTFGYHRGEVLAAFANAATIFALAALILYEAYRRFLAPPPVATDVMLAVAGAGLLANLASAGILFRGGDVRGNLNLRGAFLHVLGDLAGSVGV
ncbi:MAG: cation transporter, partial [Clostridia bacterium]|nr:cation transporter [Clostridia bacterium]